MSDRLAISATFSVLMMSIFVLFGTETARESLTPQALRAPAGLAAPAAWGAQGRMIDLVE